MTRNQTNSNKGDAGLESLWADYLSEVEATGKSSGIDYENLLAALAILNSSDPSKKAQLLLIGARRMYEYQKDLARRQAQIGKDPTFTLAYALRRLIQALLDQNIPLPENELDELLAMAQDKSDWEQLIPITHIVTAAQRYTVTRPLTESHQAHLIGLRKILHPLREAWGQVIHDVDRLLAGAGGGTNFERGDAFSDVALEDIKNMDAGERALWQKLLNHAISASSSKPSGKWLKAAAALIDAIGRERFVQRLSVWLPLIGKPGPGRIVNGFEGPMNEPTMLAEHNVDILKGLLWSVSTIHDPAHLPAMAALLGDVAEACFKKIALIGARCPRVANAALVALSLMPGPEPVAQLTRIQSKSKKPSAKKLVESAMKSAAAHQQVTPEELAEMSVPDFGFNPEGVRTMTLGDWTAEIVITGTQDVELRWRKNGATKTQASIPADVKRDHADALNQLKRTLKDINQVLPSQAIRIENLLLEQRDWPLDVWRKRYLDHPLISHIARRLIWQIEGPTPTLFIPHNGAFLNVHNDPITVRPDSHIRLWHPITSSAQTVGAWRRFLEDNQITQPFKQAHREIYVLTDAERTTGIYSNRFAAHILRQHQFHALCGTRGWSYALMGQFDSFTTPTRKLPAHDLRVEFWVNPGGTEVSGSGIFLHVSTDQVRFAPLEADVPIPLTEIPPILFSELMRDVDLFVGVCSIGNNPNWIDFGEGNNARAYAQAYSTAQLSAAAEVRRDLLERLLPKLKIAERCALDDKHLIVRGELTTYKIHLGSGNIFMEPNDQYLCIVADNWLRKGQGDIFLPFEGDTLLSLILSKAFLLADDTKISDQTITQQIGHRELRTRENG